MVVKRTTSIPKRRKRIKGYLAPYLDWLPDWKDESQYCYLLNASPQKFAWEFLRRNRHYLSMYDSILVEYGSELLNKAVELKITRNETGKVIVKNGNDDCAILHSTIEYFHSNFGVLNFPAAPWQNDFEPIFEDFIFIEKPENINQKK